MFLSISLFLPIRGPGGMGWIALAAIVLAGAAPAWASTIPVGESIAGPVAILILTPPAVIPVGRTAVAPTAGRILICEFGAASPCSASDESDILTFTVPATAGTAIMRTLDSDLSDSEFAPPPADTPLPVPTPPIKTIFEDAAGFAFYTPLSAADPGWGSDTGLDNGRFPTYVIDSGPDHLIAEPGSLVLVGMGLAGLGLARRRMRAG